MFRIKTVAPDEATGQVAEAYSVFPPEAGVPEPLQLMSASPQLVNLQVQAIRYFMNHPNLSFPLLACIRYLVADHVGYKYCMGFNQQVLGMAGMGPDDFKVMVESPMQAPLEDHERSLLDFVVRAVKDPGSIRDQDVEELKAQGWNDTDIFDALYHGAGMLVPATVMTALSKEVS